MLSLTQYSNIKFTGKSAMACAGARHDQQYTQAADPLGKGAPAPVGMR